MELLEGWIGRLVVFKIRNQNNILDRNVLEEEIFFSKVITNSKIDILLNTYSNIIRLTNQVEQLNLDPKHIFLEVLCSLQDTLGGNSR